MDLKGDVIKKMLWQAITKVFETNENKSQERKKGVKKYIMDN